MSVKELQGSFFPTTYDSPPVVHLRVFQCHTHPPTHTNSSTHTSTTQKMWIGCNNWSRWQSRNIIHSHGVSCHRWQADINIPQPLCQGLMAVHHAMVTHTHTHGTGTFTGIARSLMEMEERVRAGQEATGDNRRSFWISMFTIVQINRFLQKIQLTPADTNLCTTHNTLLASTKAVHACLPDSLCCFPFCSKTQSPFSPQTHLVPRQSGPWHL